MKPANRNKGAAHNRFKHGMTGSAIYQTWASMRARCYRESCQDFKNYGARGIKVCERWATFSNFLADMGERPSEGLTLERIDTDGDYSPGNCRWADRTTQSRNRRFVKIDVEKVLEIRRLRAQGETLVEIGRKFGIVHSHVSRIARGEAWA